MSHHSDLTNENSLNFKRSEKNVLKTFTSTRRFNAGKTQTKTTAPLILARLPLHLIFTGSHLTLTSDLLLWQRATLTQI